MNKVKYIALFLALLLFSKLMADGSMSSSAAILERMNNAVDSFAVEGEINNKNIAGLVNELHVQNKQLKPVARHEFETLQQLTEQTAAYMVKLSKMVQEESAFSPEFLELYKTNFSLIIESQKNMQSTFDAFGFDARLENMLPFIQSRMALNHAKISLLDMTADIYPTIRTADEDSIYRATTLYMLDQFDYKKLEKDPEINKDHAIIILHKLVDTIDLLQTQYTAHADTSAAKSNYITHVQKVHQQFRERLTDALEKHAKLYASDPESKGIDFGKRQLAFEKMYPLYNAAAYFQMGVNQSDYRKKIEHFGDAIRLKADFLEAYVNRGISYDALQEYDKALDDYNHVLYNDPLNQAAWYHRGMTHLNLQKYEQAIYDFERVLSLDPQDKAAILNLGAAYQNWNEHERAITYYNRALALDGTFATALRNRASLYRLQKEYDKAIADYDKVTQLSPNDATAYYNMGIIYYEQRDWQNVIEVWEKALAIEPDHARILQYLPIAKNELKQRGGAN